MTNRYLLIIISIAMIAGMSACSHLLTKKGTLVRIETDSSKIRNCKSLGTVKGTASVGLSKSQKREAALREMRNEAGLLGANSVFIISTDSMFEGTVITGTAYDCPAGAE